MRGKTTFKFWGTLALLVFGSITASFATQTEGKISPDVVLMTDSINYSQAFSSERFWSRIDADRISFEAYDACLRTSAYSYAHGTTYYQPLLNFLANKKCIKQQCISFKYNIFHAEMQLNGYYLYCIRKLQV